MAWVTFALLSALFAGLTAFLAKLGVEGISSNLATLIRTGVVLVFASGIVFFRGELPAVRDIEPRSWVFLILSGLATGLSWLFYFAALKAGPISRVAPIDKLSFVIALILGVCFLHEKINGITAAAVVLIVAGVLLTLPEVQQVVGQWLTGRGTRV